VLYGARRIAADAEAHLRAYRTDLIARITSSAFALNAIVLAVLSNASLFLVQVFAARRRREEFGVLRALGARPRQLMGLLLVEGIGMLALGLLAGMGVGYGLARIMRPFVSLAMRSSLGGYAIDRLIVDWSAVGRAYAVLALVYTATLLLILVVLVRSELHRTLRLGDE
jgi:ABC-type antimicrobial peptide transport system permease subunit